MALWRNKSELGVLGEDVWGEFHGLSHVALDLHLSLCVVKLE